MYKLARISAVNVIGFLSGLGRKKFDLDLSDRLDSPIIVLGGNNGAGKSTLLSLVHPTVWPTDGRRKFIVPGKEGTVVREYVGDDGSLIRTRCIYKPKRDGNGHTASCYFELEKDGEKAVELNPSGNVTSYEALLSTYFGITKDFVSFATYSSAVTSIVRMTDQERKDSVSMMVPNVKRFEVAYEIFNNKYKSLRTLARNVAQKILTLRDEDSLEADLKRVSDELAKYTEEREAALKKTAKLEGRLKELIGDADVEDLVHRHDVMVRDLSRCDADIDAIRRELWELYDAVGVEHRADSIAFVGMEDVPARILKYERKLAASAGTLAGYRDHVERVTKELHRTEKEIEGVAARLYGIEAQDLEELKRTEKEYVQRLKKLRYTGRAEEFEHMTYAEAVDLSRSLVTLDTMIRALYDEHGDLVTRHLNHADGTETSAAEAEALTVTIDTLSRRKDEIYRQLIEKEQYRKLQDILDQRPRGCTIDSCPFIANALKWKGIAGEIAELREHYQSLSLELDTGEKKREDLARCLAVERDLTTLRSYVEDLFPRLKRYLGIADTATIYTAIANGTWESVLDILRLKDVAAILSEKELYFQIVDHKLPEVRHAIELAKVNDTSREILREQLAQLEHTRELLNEDLGEYKLHIGISTEMAKRYRKRLENWSAIAAAVERYRETVRSRMETQDAVTEQDQRIQTIRELMKKIREKNAVVRDLDDLIRARFPRQKQLQLDLDAVRRLQIEKAEIERDFLVITTIRSIVAPGKGIRKELINIYMDEIKEIANQLLLNTFGGRLYLNDFIITDKEFVIPYTFSDSEGSDISYASASQQSTIATAISLAILSKVISSYGVLTFDEVDAPLNPKNKSEFIYVLSKQMAYIGVSQAWIVTQSPGLYTPYDVLFVRFPGLELDTSDLDMIDVE